MTEILTESFCERCGTRYTFETKAARSGRGRGFRTLSAGLKNFVLSDETSLGDAMAAARSEQDREVTHQQLDAFHKTFNFCMQCRQYTCGNCWNEGDGLCLTCSPHLGHDVLPAPFPGADATVAPAAEAERISISAEAWPALDLSPTAPEQEVRPAEPPAVFDIEPETAPEPLAAPVGFVAPVEPESVTAPEPVAEVMPEAARSVDPEVDRVVPGELSWPEDITAVATMETQGDEPALAASQPDPDLEPHETVAEVVAADQPIDPVAAVAPASPPWVEIEIEVEVAADVEPIGAHAPWEVEPVAPPEPVAAETAPVESLAESASETDPEVEELVREEPLAEPELVATADTVSEPTLPVEVEPEAWTPRPPEDVVSQPVWQIVAPDEPSQGMPGSNGEPVAPPSIPTLPAGEPQWPTASADRLEFLRQPRDAGDVWTASTQDLLARPPAPVPGANANIAIQACTSCGLSLSATARFCRRCGTRQG